MCGGFERSATTEKKFKKLADELIKNNISSFRFDYAGTGLSDGDFSKNTVKRMTDDFKRAYKKIKKFETISVVAHSLSGCVIAAALKNNNNFHRIVLIAPALNQKNLLRYWFVAQNFKNKKITWDNFRRYLSEPAFLADCRKRGKMTKSNCISPDYFLENKDKDYSEYFAGLDNVLLIHGDKDDKVPLKSLNIEFKNKIIVKGGDHDMERPDMFKQWIKKAVNFIDKQ
jgi:hypothetical protein